MAISGLCKLSSCVVSPPMVLTQLSLSLVLESWTSTPSCFPAYLLPALPMAQGAFYSSPPDLHVWIRASAYVRFFSACCVRLSGGSQPSWEWACIPPDGFHFLLSPVHFMSAAIAPRPCCGLSRWVAQHHTVLCLLPPSRWNGGENYGGKKKVELMC